MKKSPRVIPNKDEKKSASDWTSSFFESSRARLGEAHPGYTTYNAKHGKFTGRVFVGPRCSETGRVLAGPLRSKLTSKEANSLFRSRFFDDDGDRERRIAIGKILKCGSVIAERYLAVGYSSKQEVQIFLRNPSGDNSVFAVIVVCQSELRSKLRHGLPVVETCWFEVADSESLDSRSISKALARWARRVHQITKLPKLRWRSLF